MRRLFWFSYFWIYIIVTLPLLWWVLYLDRRGYNKRRDRLVQRFLAGVGRKMLKLSGSKVSVSGLDNIPATPVVFVSNHQSHFDSAVILGYIPTGKGFIAAVEASKFPIWSIWFKLAPTVFMQRDNLRQSLEAINEGIELVRRGYSMVIYPEGVISKKATMGAFKRGALRLATVPGVPIVPLAIKDTYKIMGEDNSRLTAASVELTVLAPIETKNLTKHEVTELPARIQEAINAILTS